MINCVCCTIVISSGSCCKLEGNCGAAECLWVLDCFRLVTLCVWVLICCED